jgi:hypothetical protein
VNLTRLGYREIAQRYKLAPIENGADLALTPTGDLALTKDFDLKLGDDVQSALGRLVARWRFNAPVLNTLLTIVIEAKQRLIDAEKARDEVATLLRADREAALKIWHDAGDEIGVHEFGPEACAGAIMVVLQSLLRREWTDLNEPSTWDTAGELIAGHAFGPIVEAAANNFRHFDEWAREAAPKTRQMNSIRVLADVLGDTLSPNGANHKFRGNKCPEILTALCNDSFETLMDRFFGFARGLAGL